MLPTALLLIGGIEFEVDLQSCYRNIAVLDLVHCQLKAPQSRQNTTFK